MAVETSGRDKGDYGSKRSFEATPEPPPRVAGDVDPATAPPGKSFVIHQHHATRLHFDLRLEMMNGTEPVLVSWAVPKNLPRDKSSNSLAIKVEDHPFEYGSFSGTIPKGNYGAGEVRVFDHGQLEVMKQEQGKLTFALEGERLKGVYTLIRWKVQNGKEQWLARLKEDRRDPPEDWPASRPMRARRGGVLAADDDAWAYQPSFEGNRVFVRCAAGTEILGEAPMGSAGGLAKLHDQVVALEAMLDGVLVHYGDHDCFVAFDLIYLDGKDITACPLAERLALLDEVVVASDRIQVAPWVEGAGSAMRRAAGDMGIEKIVAKRLDSAYQPGITSEDWLEIS